MVCGNCNNYNDDHAEQCAYCGMPLYPNIHKKKETYEMDSVDFRRGSSSNLFDIRNCDCE